MKKFFVCILVVVSILCSFAAEKEFYLHGRVKESLGKTDLTNAYVLTYDGEGNVADSVRANGRLAWRFNALDTLSFFYISVPRVDSTYVFDVVCEGFKPLSMTYRVENIGKRETSRDLGVIYLDRAPVMLKDVTVTTSKIKFYNDGDTLVYNADAFQLAEGSMLDALIAQLPGVELNTNGQIKVNGEFVESLLLDGKQFFDGNNNLMLENIAAYTVKDIKVYEAAKKQDELMGNAVNKVLTMNVRLKKEYNIGWLLNLQGGYGTNNRYVGKLFASWFNPTTRISLISDLNNLNSNKTPGRDDTWTPDQLPDGTKTYAIGGLNYNYEHPEGKKYAEGNVMFVQTIDNVSQTSERINFIPGGNTFENSFSKSHTRVSALNTNHFLSIEATKRLKVGLLFDGHYYYTKDNSSALSGSFSKDPGEMTIEILDAIYSNGSSSTLESILNRSKTRTDRWNKEYSFWISPYINLSLPKSNDNLSFTLDVGYRSEKEDKWNDYEIDYGPEGNLNPERARQFTNNSPNHGLKLGGAVSYRSSGEHFNIFAEYKYDFSEVTKDSYMYALDELKDMGIYGVLPADYMLAFNPANSFSSRTFTNRHSLNPNFMFRTTVAGENALQINIMPDLELQHRRFDYWSNNVNQKLSKTYLSVSLTGYWRGMIQYDFNKKSEGRQRRFRNSVRYSYSITPTLPDPFDMVERFNDANPLNIYVGNPNLRTARRHRHLFRWQYIPHSHPTFNNILYLSFTHANNSLTRGYTYDTSTGMRINKMYNVDGNHNWALTNELKWQFGSTKQFTLSSMTDGILATYNDMIGVDLSEPEKVTVRNNTLTENVKFVWQIGKQNIGLRCDFTTRHTTSEQPGFNTLNAQHVNYGISGNFILPAGFGISTDFMCYMRRGYGSDYLDTTDPVWNMRVSYAPPRSKHWVIMLDGFDLLHQLSNVNYAVTASGRTVSYTNTIPRYLMLSVQYRLNIQPKKR